MKKILKSLSIIGLVGMMAIGATMSYLSDTETSAGNTFTAGTIDLKIDYKCGTNCSYPLDDLDGATFFNHCDVKPGDKDEVTISWHVINNEAWGRLRMSDIKEYEYKCTEPEKNDPVLPDVSCGTDDIGLGLGEMGQYLKFTAWMDEGIMQGWQCGNVQGGCAADPKEGNNVFDIGTYDVKIADNVSVSDLVSGIPLPGKLQPQNTYFVGLEWNLPFATPNIVQTDSLKASIIMEVVQSRNNPNPWTP